jgi:uncharacterized membrane protein (DUF106 family)
MPGLKRNALRTRRESHLTQMDSTVPPSQHDYGPLEQTYMQCATEARWWFYVSIVAAIVAAVITLTIVCMIVNFILLKGLDSISLTATLTSIITSLINGVITYLVFSQKRYANERVDSYAERINRKASEEENGEKLRELIAIVLDSHLSREDQSNMIKEIISRKALIVAPEVKPNKGTV